MHCDGRKHRRANTAIPICFLFLQLVKLKMFSPKRMGSRYSDGLRAGVRILAGSRDFSLLHGVEIGSGPHPASYPMGTGGSFPEVKAAMA
jgi:hypothetical protein